MVFISKLWNVQWLTAFGAILSVLGVLYTGCSYLDKHKRFKFIKAITQGLAIGIVVAMLFTFFALIAVLTGYLINALLNSVIHQSIELHPTDFSVNFSIEIPGGLIIGTVLGILYSLLREKNKENKEKIKSVFAEHLFLFGLVGFMLMLGCSIGLVAWTLSPGLFLPHQDIFSILIFSSGDIGGFLFGIVIIRGRRSPWKNFIVCFLLFIPFLLFFILLNNHDNHVSFIYEKVMQDIFYGAQLGLLVGVSINTSKRVKTEYKRGAQENFLRWLIFDGKGEWEDFFYWLVLGGIVVPILYLSIFNIGTANIPFIFFTLRYFLILGIVNGHGDQIIERIRLKGYIKEKDVYYSISGKRFVYGLIIGILYVFPVALFVLLTDVLLGQSSSNAIFNFSQNIDFALLVGLIIGFIYGCGPFIISRIDNLEERQLGQLGIIVTELGLIITILPH